MGCLFRALRLLVPRLALVGAYFLTEIDFLGIYGNLLWPAAGLVVLPWTTLAYAWAVHTHGSIEGLYLGVVALAALGDLLALRRTRAQPRDEE